VNCITYHANLMPEANRIASMHRRACVLAGLVHSPANAALVSFISDGTFSSVTNCTGGSPGCSITDSGNVLRMSGASNQNQPSTLTITYITRTNISTNKNDYVIGKITWVNLATYNTDQNFNVNYTFSLHFTSPGASLDSQLLNLNIQQTTNPSPDNVSASARQRSTTLVRSPSTALKFPTFTSLYMAMDRTTETNGRPSRTERRRSRSWRTSKT
jgi:hypothetical protein